MHKTLVLVAILLCGCADPPLRQFNTAQADHVRQVMEQCAAIIAKHAFMLARVSPTGITSAAWCRTTQRFNPAGERQKGPPAPSQRKPKCHIACAAK